MLSIGAVAHAAGVSPRAVRYYEQQGLLASERSSGGQRRFPELAIERVTFIQQLIQAGLSSATIRDLLPCMDSRVATSKTIQRLEEERNRIQMRAEDLTRMGERLDRLIEQARNSASAINAGH